MLTQISRPNFFPGQMIDYKDFNRLAAHTDKTLSVVCQQLFPQGGIVTGALETFQIVPLEGVSLMVKPGVAFLPNGETLIASKDRLIDLKEYVGKTSRTLIVSLKNQIQGQDKYVDEEDASISGYKCEVFDASLSVSSKKPSAGAVEIFRVNLNPSVRTLRLATQHEEWLADLSAEGSDKAGIIDTRYRRRIVPQTTDFGSVSELIEARTALSSLGESVSSLENLYIYKDKQHVREALTQLHAEFLTAPFQAARAGFLASECARRLALYLERLERHVGHQAEELNREALLATISDLEQMRSLSLYPEGVNIGLISKVARALEGLVSYGDQKVNLLSTLQEGLRDIADYNFSYAPKISLAGRVFKRADYVDASDEKRVRVLAEQSHLRKMSAAFSGGEVHHAKGLFVKEGTFTIYLNNIEPEKPLLLLSRRYVRRAGSRIHYELNGRPLITEDETSNEKANCWVNKGLVAAPEALVPQGNCLKIRVEKSDLDFGFFDLALYQPFSGAEEAEVTDVQA